MDLRWLIHGPPRSSLTDYIIQLVPHDPISRNILIFVSLYYREHEPKEFIAQLATRFLQYPPTSMEDLKQIAPSVPWHHIPLKVNGDGLFQRLGVKHTSPPIITKNIILRQIIFESASGFTLDDIEKVPFFDRVDSSHFPKGDFIMASELYQPINGLSPEMILTSPFLYLTHAINPEYLDDIMESGMLKTPRELDDGREDQYPGIYFVPNILSEPYNNMDLDIILIFSLALLKRKAWHILRDGFYGNIGETTWDYTTLPGYLRSHYNDKPFDEVVFHDNIPLDYLEVILVNDDLEEIDPEHYKEIFNKYPAMKLSEFKKLPVYRRVKRLYIDDPLDVLEPNLCYNNQGSDTPVDLSMRNIKYTLMNCGYSKDEVSKFLSTKSKSELIDLIDKRYDGRYEPVYHPPY